MSLDSYSTHHHASLPLLLSSTTCWASPVLASPCERSRARLGEPSSSATSLAEDARRRSVLVCELEAVLGVLGGGVLLPDEQCTGTQRRTSWPW